MVTPTLDVNELDRRIMEMKAVEGWLKMNTQMLSVTIQGLEMQRAAVAAVQAMSQAGTNHQSGEPQANPFASAAMWPWNMMQPGAANAPQAQPSGASDTK
jgi:hypothetical protein